MAVLKAWQAQAIAPADVHMQKMASITKLLLDVGLQDRRQT
jgi:hypothetical protein